LRKDGKVEFPGELAADLNQTHGMPLEILELFLADRGFRLDRPGYEQARERHERVSKAGRMAEGAVFASGPLSEVKAFSKGTEFLGYEALHAKVRVIAIIKDEKLVDAAHDGDRVTVICDKTPFYGESGGQTGDQGLLKGAGVEVRVEDTQKKETYQLHVGQVKTGSLRKGDEVEAQVDAGRRAGSARNHTATHLLQWALRTVVGQGVIQQGSLVAPDRLRFDFTHFHSLSREELSRIEELVNERIVENTPLKVQEMGFDEAKKEGALAFFEKYGDKVRVVNVGGFSKELCGGTHVKRTGDIGYFRIVSEGSIASGVRRIEALTGPSAVRRAQDSRGALEEAASMLNVPPDRMIEKLGAVLDEVKGLKSQIAKAQKQAASQAVAGISAQAEEVDGVRVLVQRHEGKGVDELRALADAFRKSNATSAVCLVSTGDGKATLIVGYTPDLVARGLDAGATVRTVSKVIGGSGGGKKDFAQAGGKDPSKADEALAAFRAHLA
ncbi:MAG: alanine--tRNA ligase-related protein, partial [Planctomycetota bacterium]